MKELRSKIISRSIPVIDNFIKYDVEEKISWKIRKILSGIRLPMKKELENETHSL